MIKYIKNKLKKFIYNSLYSASDDVKESIYNSLFSSALKLEQDRYRKKYDISNEFRFNGIYIYLYGDGKIILGENSYIGDYSTIQSSPACEVKVGKKCSLSHNVRIYTESIASDQDFSEQNLVSKKGNVIIEDFVWIGANVFINPGVTIGKNSIVGANSVVVRDLPPNGIYGGVPAKLIKLKSN